MSLHHHLQEAESQLNAVRGRLIRALVIVLLGTLAAGPLFAVQHTGFDHLTTGFELQGAHRDLSCEYCHAGGVFRGTPRTCVGCHTTGGRINATPKPPKHILSADDCALCHAIYNFVPIFRMDHLAARGTCFSCHNNVTAQGKGPNHIPSDNNCTACHTTNAFLPAVVEHADLQAVGQCQSCHSGVRASAKPMAHIPTAADCGSCHTTLSWTSVRLDHSTLTANCQVCHNGTGATGRVAGHLATAHDCATCHHYPNWTPVIFVHSSAQYPDGHTAAAQCSACHASSLDQASWRFAAYRPTCAGCHAEQFKPDGHDKTVGGLPYTAAELKDCTGACHVYTDATLTRVAKTRPGGHHKVTDGAFK